MRLPKFLRFYFWEIDPDGLDLKKDSAYILKRLLDYGDIKSARWAYQNFSKRKIKEVLLKSRGLSPKTAAFWAAVLGVPEKKVLCLQKSYRQRLRQHFLY